MTVRLAVLQHEPERGLGRFAELLADPDVSATPLNEGAAARPAGVRRRALLRRQSSPQATPACS